MKQVMQKVVRQRPLAHGKTAVFLGRLLHRFGRDQAGAVAVIAAVVFPVLIGALGLGAETGYWFMMQRKIQHAADLSAHAGAVRLRANEALKVQEAVGYIASKSGLPAEGATLAVTTPYKGDAMAVEVVIEQSVPRLFSSVFLKGPILLRARTVARVDGRPPRPCILALSPDAGGAITVWGSSSVKLSGCDLVANSSAANAIDLNSGVSITSGCAYAVGGAQGTQHLTVGGDCTGVRKLNAPAPDPFAHVVGPDSSKCGTVWEGLTVRCFSGLKLSNTNIFSNSLYIITSGELSAAAGSILRATNVSFHLAGTAKVNLQGNAEMDLTAPTAGAYAGILIHGAQANTVSNTLRGNVDSALQGALYFPNSTLEYSGNSATGCTEIVAQKISFTGNSDVTCVMTTSAESTTQTSAVRLVE